MVFPACTDVRLGFLLDVWELETPLVLPLELPPPREDKAGVAASAAAAKRKGAVTKVGDSDGPDAAAADEVRAVELVRHGGLSLACLCAVHVK